MVGLEPSCVAVFRDELPNLFPDDPRARRLARADVHVLAEFLETQATRSRCRGSPRRALVQGHCHHHAVMGLDAEQAVLERLGLDCERRTPAAAAWRARSASRRATARGVDRGRRARAPARRARAPEGTLVLADGFSCREQIAQGTDRQGLHLAQVLQLGRARDGAALGDYPERAVLGHLPPLPLRARLGRGFVKATLALAVLALAIRLVRARGRTASPVRCVRARSRARG